MSNLYVSDSSGNVQVAELGLIAGKQQMILGNFERDLILRTSGNVQVQVGNKFYSLNYNSSTTNDGTTNVIASNTTILDLDSDLAGLTYPGDGNYVFIKQSSSFYIASENKYVKLNNSKGGPTGPIVSHPDTGLYLSYSDTQTLTGTQKLKVVLNSGNIQQFSDITGYTSSDIYTNQLIYSISDAKHYILTTPNSPSLKQSWQEAYLSLLTGGNVLGPTSISIDKSSVATLSSLHIIGDGPLTYTKPTSPTALFTIGKSDYSTGVAMWTNNGDTHFRLLNTDYHKAFYFEAYSSLGSKTPLAISGGSVGVGGIADQRYMLNVTGTSNFSGNITQSNNTTSTDFTRSVSGFAITKDGANEWTIEADYVIARKNLTRNSQQFLTHGLNGSQIVNYEILVLEADFVEQFNIYITASSSGHYTNNTGTIVKQLTDRATRARVVHIPIANLDTVSPSQAYETIQLSYAIGDVFPDNSIDTSTTYNKTSTSTYYTPAGNTRYDSGTVSFVPDVSGTLLQINSINVYRINSTASLSVGDLLYYKSWNVDKSFADIIRAEVVRISTVDQSYYVYVYDSGVLQTGSILLKVGNTAATGAMLQTNASDIYSPYTELVTGISSFNMLSGNYYYQHFSDYPGAATDYAGDYDFKSNSQTLQSNTRVKLGDLSNITDTTLALSTQQYGLYSDNVYLKGNFVLNRGVYNNIPIVTSYHNFIMLNGSNMIEQIDMSAEIANWDSIYAGTPNVYIKNQTSGTQTAGFIVDSASRVLNTFITGAANLAAASLTGLVNPTLTGRVMIGWNRSGSLGEIDFLSNRGVGVSAAGGFRFIDVDNSSIEKMILDLNGTTGAMTTGGTIVPGSVPTYSTVATKYLTLDSVTGQIVSRTTSQVLSDIGAGTGGGSVTSVSVTTANGVSGSVATSTTTPAITLTLGAITPTSTNGVSAATMAFLDATSSVQTQLNTKEVALTFSTGLTRATNTITNNLSVGVSGGQSVIGGTAVTDALNIQGTTGNGTLTSAAINFKVGNAGSTTALTTLNNGNIGILNTAPSQALEVGSTSTAGNLSVTGLLGSELTPTITAGNWTLVNWTISAGTLVHTTGTIGSATPVSAITPTVGTTYKLVINITSGGVQFIVAKFGGVNVALLAPGVVTTYITALTTSAFTISNATTTDAIVISSVSLKAVSNGNLVVDGHITVNSYMSLSNLGIGLTTVPPEPLTVVDNNSTGIRIIRSVSVPGQYMSINEAGGSAHTIQTVGDKPFNIIAGSTIAGNGIQVTVGGTTAAVFNLSGVTLLNTATDNASGAKLQVNGKASMLGTYIIGSSSGTISILSQAVAGTYNFNLPITAGSAGQALISQGGSSTAMTWSSVLFSRISTAVSTTTTLTIVANTDQTVRITAGSVYTVTLPTAVGLTGTRVTLKIISGANTITIATTSSQTIDVATTYSLTALYKYVELESNGASWDIVANN